VLFRSSIPSGHTLRQEISLSPNQPAADAPEDTAPEKSFWEKLYEIPDEAWWGGVHGEKGVRVYLYRDEPGAAYIAVIKEPFDIDWVKAKYGGGRYRAMLNDAGGRAIAVQKFTVEGASKRPAEADPAAAAPHDAMTAMVDMIREEQRETRALVRELLGRDRNPSPVSPMDMQMQMLPTMLGVWGKIFEGMIPRQTDPLELLVKLQNMMRPVDTLQIIKDAKAAGLIPEATPAGNMLEQLSGMMAVAEKLNNLGGGGPGAGKSWAELLIDKGPDILRVFSDGIKQYKELEEKRLETAKFIATNQPRQIPPAPHPQPGPPPHPAPASQPATPAVNQGPANAQPLNVEPIGAQPAPQAGAVAEVTEAQVTQVKMQVVQAIVAGETGEDIFSFLKIQAPVFLTGMCFYDDAGKVTGVVSLDQLAQFCAADPVLGQAAQHPRFRPVLKELLAELKYVTMGIEEGPDQAVG